MIHEMVFKMCLYTNLYWSGHPLVVWIQTHTHTQANTSPSQGLKQIGHQTSILTGNVSV